jgi:hypothetical protein
MPPATNPAQLTGDWRKLYDWLVLDPTCECCSQTDLNAEALAIVNAAMAARPLAKGQGCIASSLTLFQSLVGGLGNHALSTTTGTVQGASWFGKTPRTWVEIDTHCYTIINVAWWSGIFRHQAIGVFPKCYRGWILDNPFATVIDLWGPAGKVWNSWKGWIGGMGELNKSAGRVRDGF